MCLGFLNHYGEDTIFAVMGNCEAKNEMAFCTGIIKMEGSYDHANSLCKQRLPSMRSVV